MKIGAIGYNYTHGKEFLMDRPNGPGCWLMLLIKSTALFELGGVEQTVKENSFVILSYDMPCKYRALTDVYTDDWMYFELESGDTERFAELGIPINKIVHLGNIEEISQIMHIMTYEHYAAGEFLGELEKSYLNIVLLKLSRIIKKKSYMVTADFMEKNYRFTQLRALIYTVPESVSDIDKMSEDMGMSRSGFQHLYKKMFGVSVMTDVINGRLDKAKRLLSSTGMTISEIAQRCGYESEYNFMRQFKGRIGKTPTEYRRCI